MDSQFSLKHFISSLLVVASGSEIKRRSIQKDERKHKQCTATLQLPSSAETESTKQHNQLKLFLIGGRRTGTVTITSLLEEIGYGLKYHGWSLWWNKDKDIDFWLNVIEQKGVNIDWDELFVDHGPYHVTSDEPSILFWKSIVEYYPSMKVVLTTRSPERWFNSYYNAILRLWPYCDHLANISRYFLRSHASTYIKFFKVFQYGILETFGTLGPLFGMEPFDKTRAIKQFIDRNAEIMRYFEETNQMDRLFVIDWERKDKNEMFLEFMRFLEIEMTPHELEERKRDNNGYYFPHRNNTAKLQKDIMLYLCREFSVLYVGAVILMVFGLCLAFTYI